jgi:hypothetical protein
VEYKQDIEKAMETHDRTNNNHPANHDTEHGGIYTIMLTPREYSVLKLERTSIYDNPILSATDTTLTLDMSTETKRDHLQDLLMGLDFAATKRNTKEFKAAAETLYEKVAAVWDGNVAPD